MAEAPGALHPLPLVEGDKTLAQVTQDVRAAMEGRPSPLWWAGLLVSLAALVGGGAAAAYLFATGVGTWGINRTVGWAIPITLFVFWIGIGHAGTLISAI